jgi:putative hemolysin
VGNSVFEVLIIFVLLIANGIFAMSEIAIVSARKTRLQQLAEEGNASAQTALDLATNSSQFLSTVQIGITLIGILAGAFGGATLAEGIASGLATIPQLMPYSEAIGVGIVVVVITYLSLIIGELVPKRVALNNPERIAASVAGPMNALSRVASPLVRLLSGSTDVIIRLLGIKPSDEPAVTEEEVKVLIEQGTQVGVFHPVEQDMIEGVLRLGERSVAAVMTPRTQIVWIDLNDPAEEIYRKVVGSHHSRFPVARESLDNFLGIILAKDLLAQHWQGQPLDLKSLLREPLFVPETMPALRLLELFKKKGTHVAMVLDEYGGVQGMITHNDILEDIAGNVSVPGEPAEPQAVRREDGSWLVDGLLHIDRLKEIFDLDELPREELSLYQTVGGFVVDQFGNIPSAGQSFAWEGLRFEVVDMDAHRVDKVLVQKAKTE